MARESVGRCSSCRSGGVLGPTDPSSDSSLVNPAHAPSGPHHHGAPDHEREGVVPCKRSRPTPKTVQHLMAKPPPPAPPASSPAEQDRSPPATAFPPRPAPAVSVLDTSKGTLTTTFARHDNVVRRPGHRGPRPMRDTATRTPGLPEADRTGSAGRSGHPSRQLCDPQTREGQGLLGETTPGTICTSPRSSWLNQVERSQRAIKRIVPERDPLGADDFTRGGGEAVQSATSQSIIEWRSTFAGLGACAAEIDLLRKR